MTSPRTIECTLPTSRRQSTRPARPTGSMVFIGPNIVGGALGSGNSIKVRRD
jgi:hypothetical protein